MGLGLILGIGMTVLAAVNVSAQINAEYRVKGKLLYNFAKFVEWPPDAWSAVGTSPPGDAHAHVVEWKTVRGQPLCRRQIQASGAAASCRIRFTSDPRSKHILTIRDAVRGCAVLTIGECPRLTDRGVVNFKIDGHVRIEIDQAAAEERKLTINSEMKLAEGHTEIA